MSLWLLSTSGFEHLQTWCTRKLLGDPLDHRNPAYPHIPKVLFVWGPQHGGELTDPCVNGSKLGPTPLGRARFVSVTLGEIDNAALHARLQEFVFSRRRCGFAGKGCRDVEFGFWHPYFMLQKLMRL